MQLEETTPFTECDGGLMTLLVLRSCDEETGPEAKSEVDNPLEFLAVPPDEKRSGDFGFEMVGPKSRLLNCCCVISYVFGDRGRCCTT
jgi:hypothetical protein